MFPPQFDYRRAASLEEAIDLLAAEGDRDAVPVAGAQGLLMDMKRGATSPDVLVDIGDLEELRSIGAADDGGTEVGDTGGTGAGEPGGSDAEGTAASDVGGTGESDGDAVDAGDVDADRVTIGALSTHADLATSSVLADRVPVIADAAAQVADRQIRNRGTIGGNLAEADPGADLPAAVVAADATVHARGPSGTRAIPAETFFRGSRGTALSDDELVTAITVPSNPGAGAYAKKTHPATGYAMVGVAVRGAVDGGTLSAVRLAVGGATERPVRLETVEDALEGTALEDADALSEAASLATDDLADVPANGDARASGAFRRRLVAPYVERTIDRALEDYRAPTGDGGSPREPDGDDDTDASGGADR